MRRALRTGCWLGRVALLGGALAAAPAHSVERAKTDVIVLRNGDRVTGRLLSLQYGILQMNTVHTGDVSIEWPSIDSIQSTYTFRVETLAGQHYVGVIHSDDDGRNLLVGAEGEAVAIPMQAVASLVPYEADFWQRINGSVALGYNFTHSDEVSQGSFDFTARYSDAALQAGLGAHFAATHSAGDNNSDQSQITSSVFFLRPGPNFWGLLSSLERDQNLGIDARLTLGAALGRHFYQSQAASLQGIAGLSYAQEWAAGDGHQSSLEAVVGGDWRVYRFTYPKLNLMASLLTYTSITDAPRFRANLNITLTFKLTNRFSLRVSEFGNYDSRPPTSLAQTLDYGLTTSLAYDFGAVIP